ATLAGAVDRDRTDLEEEVAVGVPEVEHVLAGRGAVELALEEGESLFPGRVDGADLLVGGAEARRTCLVEAVEDDVDLDLARSALRDGAGDAEREGDQRRAEQHARVPFSPPGFPRHDRRPPRPPGLRDWLEHRAGRGACQPSPAHPVRAA